jgi:nicotinamide mononucleotide transporter
MMAWVELAAALLSVLNVWLSVKRRLSSYPVGLAASAAYAWVFIDARLYSDALLQGIFAIVIVYGWVHWMRHLDTGGRVRVAPLRWRSALVHVALGVLCAVVLGYGMQHWTNAALPRLDATLTAASLVGSWWEARRHLAAWWLWIVVDSVYVGEYVYKDLRITALLYAGFVLLAIAGLRTWQRAAEGVPAQ